MEILRKKGIDQMKKLPIRSVEQFYINTKNKGRLVCLDLGTKNIGVALTDINQSNVFPLGTIKTPDPQLFHATLNSILLRSIYNTDISLISGFVIGDPLDYDGNSTPQTKIYFDYLQRCMTVDQKKKLIGNTQVHKVGQQMDWKNLVFIDERFSTALVRKGYQVQQRQNKSLNVRQNFFLSKDTQAAMYILETYLQLVKNTLQNKMI